MNTLGLRCDTCNEWRFMQDDYRMYGEYLNGQIMLEDSDSDYCPTCHNLLSVRDITPLDNPI